MCEASWFRFCMQSPMFSGTVCETWCFQVHFMQDLMFPGILFARPDVSRYTACETTMSCSRLDAPPVFSPSCRTRPQARPCEWWQLATTITLNATCARWSTYWTNQELYKLLNNSELFGARSSYRLIFLLEYFIDLVKLINFISFCFMRLIMCIFICACVTQSETASHGKRISRVRFPLTTRFLRMFFWTCPCRCSMWVPVAWKWRGVIDTSTYIFTTSQLIDWLFRILSNGCSGLQVSTDGRGLVSLLSPRETSPLPWLPLDMAPNRWRDAANHRLMSPFPEISTSKF